jgi:hypothetical protein
MSIYWLEMSPQSVQIRRSGQEIAFETLSPLRRTLKRAVVNPLANYLPAGLLRAVLRFGKSELASANWNDPGGWQSMVISYNGNCRQIADRILISGGTIAMALRNRKRLAAHLIAGLIDSAGVEPVHVLCLGAGPGQIIIEALAQASVAAYATLVDRSADAFEFGRQLAARHGLGDSVRYVQADVRDLHEFLRERPHLVKMLGICEYLPDEQIMGIAHAAAEIMPDRAPIVFNSLSRSHGTDRFFRRVFGLNMIHRSVGQVEQLMTEAGFGDFAVHPEPLGVYHVIVGRKVAPAARR